MIPLLLSVVAILSYFLGGINAAVFLSRNVFHRDIRRIGNCNASYANFTKVFGAGWGAALIALDVFKTAVPVLAGMLILKIPGNGYPVMGMLFAGFCVVLGDTYPWRFRFRGGKGVVCCLTALWLADWRAGLIASLIYAVTLAFSRLTALAGFAACLSGPILCWCFVDKAALKGQAGLLALFMAVVILFRQRASLGRILSGSEPQIRWGRQAEDKLKEDRF